MTQQTSQHCQKALDKSKVTGNSEQMSKTINHSGVLGYKQCKLNEYRQSKYKKTY